MLLLLKLNVMLLLLLLTPNKILKKTENRILLNISGLGPSTNGKDLKKGEKLGNSKIKKKNREHGRKKTQKSKDVTEN